MKINGLEGLTVGDVHQLVADGGKFVMYPYCVSIGVMTFRRNSGIYFLRPGKNAVIKGLPWTFCSLIFGWWGIPWGFIYTPGCLVTNLGGGKNVTAEVLQAISTGNKQTSGYETALPAVY